MSKKTLRKVVLLVIMMLAIMTILSVKTKALTNEEAKSIVFDAQCYNSLYDDIRNEYNWDEAKSYEHFLTYGIKEGRVGSPLFEAEYYAAIYGDLWDAYVEYDKKSDELVFDYEGLYNHFLAFGYNEGRTGTPVYDLATYSRYTDLKAAFKEDKGAYYTHFAVFGINEGRTACDWFNAKCYVNSYKDLQVAFKQDYRQGLNHYYVNVVNGEEGRDKIFHEYVDEKVEATCDTAGREKHQCVNCGDGYDREIPALGHDLTGTKVEKEATCTTDGEYTVTCKRCNYRVGKIEPALGHSYVYNPSETDGKHTKECERAAVCHESSVEEDCTPVEGGWTLYNNGTDPAKYQVNTCDLCGRELYRSRVEAVEDEADGTAETELTLTAEEVQTATELTIPEGKEVKIEGKVETGTINVDGKLTLTAMPEEQVTVEAAEGAVVELETATEIKEGLESEYVTDVTLTSEATVTDKLTVGAEAEKTLNLNGNQLSLNAQTSSADKPLVEVEEEGTLTINGNGATLVGVANSSEDLKNKVIDNKGTLDIKNVTLKGGDRGINSLGSLTATDVKIETPKGGIFLGENAGTTTLERVDITTTDPKAQAFSTNARETIETDDITLTDCHLVGGNRNVAAYFPAKGNVTIMGGSIEGGTALEVKGVNLTIGGGLALKSNDASGGIQDERSSEYIKSKEGWCDGSALLIVSQAAYADGQTLTIEVGDVTFNGHVVNGDRQGCDIQIVGTNSAKDGKGANLNITFDNITFDENNCSFGAHNTVSSKALKPYLIDVGTSCTTTIMVNGDNMKSKMSD